MGHGPIDLQVDVFGKVFSADYQLLPIYRLPPPGKLPGLAGILLPEGSFHAPVVRQVHGFPLPVLFEGPSFVEQGPPGRLRRGADGQEAYREKYEEFLHNTRR